MGGHSEDQPWDFFGRNDAKAETPTLWLATSCEDLTHWKRLWCWEGLGAGAEGDDRGWDGWVVSPTRWIGVWVNSRIWWWTGRPGVLQFMGSQRVRHDWMTELNWTELNWTETLNAKFGSDHSECYISILLDYSFQPCPGKCHSGNVLSWEKIMRLLLDTLSKLIKSTKLIIQWFLQI